VSSVHWLVLFSCSYYGRRLLTIPNQKAFPRKKSYLVLTHGEVALLQSDTCDPFNCEETTRKLFWTDFSQKSECKMEIILNESYLNLNRMASYLSLKKCN